MVRTSKLLILFVFVLALGIMSAPEALAKTKKKTAATAPNNKYASIVIDAETGAILAQANPDKALHPASLTKLMTLALTFDALDKGTLRANERIPVSRRAASMMPSKLGLKPGETIRVQDAVNAVITKSANDMAVALAEAAGGSEQNFTRMMNAKAQAIGMNRTRFVNASGLHDPRQVSTARDMAKLARYMITAQAKYYPLFNRKSFTYAGHTYSNHNRLMNSYAGMDGMKTGYVTASGFNLVASAKRGDSRLIAVVFGGQSANSRNVHMASLLDGGFVSMNNIRIAQAKAQNSRIASAVSVPSIGPVVDAGTAPLAVETAAIAPAAAPIQTGDGQMGLVTLSANSLTVPEREIAAPAVSSFTTPVPARSSTVVTTRVTSRTPAAAQAVRVASLATTSDAAPIVPTQVAYEPSSTTGSWAIQVGAFQSRVATDQAIYQAQHKLPQDLANRTSAMIVPLRTADATWVFRARISGFTSQGEAQQACARVGNCLVVSLQAY